MNQSRFVINEEDIVYIGSSYLINYCQNYTDKDSNDKKGFSDKSGFVEVVSDGEHRDLYISCPVSSVGSNVKWEDEQGEGGYSEQEEAQEDLEDLREGLVFSEEVGEAVE